jgi:hypothetical protein
MTSFKFARFALPALAAAVIGLGAQAAVAQTSTAPGTMSQGSMSQGSMSNMGSSSMSTSKSHMTHGGLAAGEKFSSVATAQAHCPGDTVVWSTMSKSKTFHTSSSKYFGKTKHGAYVCEKTATAAGFHAAKN